MDDSERRLLDHVQTTVFVLELDEEDIPRYVAFNEYGCKYLHLKSEKDVLGLTAKEVFPGRLGQIAYQRHLTTLRTGKRQVNDILLPLGGRTYSAVTTLDPVRDDAGRVYRIVGTATDRTEQHILTQMQYDLDAMKTESEEFVSLAAHDLRAPMRHVQTIAGMLRQDFQDHGVGKLELIDMLEEMGTRAMDLISDVLSHAQAMSAEEEVRDFDFGDLARQVMALLDLTWSCDTTITEARVHGDRIATQIALRNLVDNALKHAKGQGDKAKRLRLDIDIEPCGPDAFVVHVSDNGVGFDDPTLLFLGGGELRVDSGYGLMGVRRLIQSRGGQMNAENRDNQAGARISFTLPGRVEVRTPAAMPLSATGS